MAAPLVDVGGEGAGLHAAHEFQNQSIAKFPLNYRKRKEIQFSYGLIENSRLE